MKWKTYNLLTLKEQNEWKFRFKEQTRVRIGTSFYSILFVYGYFVLSCAVLKHGLVVKANEILAWNVLKLGTQISIVSVYIWIANATWLIGKSIYYWKQEKKWLKSLNLKNRKGRYI